MNTWYIYKVRTSPTLSGSSALHGGSSTVTQIYISSLNESSVIQSFQHKTPNRYIFDFYTELSHIHTMQLSLHSPFTSEIIPSSPLNCLPSILSYWSPKEGKGFCLKGDRHTFTMHTQQMTNSWSQETSWWRRLRLLQRKHGLCNTRSGQWGRSGASSYLFTERMFPGSSIVAVECNKTCQGHNMVVMYTNSHGFSLTCRLVAYHNSMGQYYAHECNVPVLKDCCYFDVYIHCQ